MSADALKEYFEPLIAYLDTANKDYDQTFPSSSKWMPCAAGECPPKNDGSGTTTVPSNTTVTSSTDSATTTTSDATTTIFSSALLAIFALLW